MKKKVKIKNFNIRVYEFFNKKIYGIQGRVYYFFK